MPDLDEALDLEGDDGLADRCPAHAEAVGQFPLRGQPVAGVQAP